MAVEVGVLLLMLWRIFLLADFFACTIKKHGHDRLFIVL
jgi:hypothetical protein